MKVSFESCFVCHKAVAKDGINWEVLGNPVHKECEMKAIKKIAKVCKR